MNSRTMYVIALAVYLLFVIALIALMMLVSDESAKLMGMYMLSTGLMVATMILAIIFMRDSNSDRYREMFGDEEDRKE